MMPPVYQTVFRKHLSETQYLILELLILLIQSQRQVQLSRLASMFPQPIQYESRIKNLQRFLSLPKLSVRLLWFPIIKYFLRSEKKKENSLNRQRRRNREKLKQHGYWLLALDRTEWKEHNIFMISLIWGNHALPIYWKLKKKKGSSSLEEQKSLLSPVLGIFKGHEIVVVGDREFHSPKLAKYLESRKVSFVLREKKSFFIQETPNDNYKAIGSLGFTPGTLRFYEDIFVGKQDKLGKFNVLYYWKRSYRKKVMKAPWYILTNLKDTKVIISLYRSRWGIEMFFKDCKSGGYNLEQSKVSQTRFMAIILLMVIAYTLATCQGHLLKKSNLDTYSSRVRLYHNLYPHHSELRTSLYGHVWIIGMDLWADLAHALIRLKPHKQRYFNRGFEALSLMQPILQNVVTL